MAVKLRKKAPFHCRAPKVGGVKGLCLAVLTEQDGDKCPACAKAAHAAREKFFNAPVKPVQTEAEAQRDAEWEARRAKGPIWPI